MLRFGKLRPAALALTLLSALPAAVRAQLVPRPSPGTLSGVVVDTTGAPIAGAEVFYGDDRTRTVAGPDGVFRFTNVRRGDYAVTARRVGFLPQSIEIAVPDSGATMRITLIRLAGVLPPVITSATRTGFSGVVTDSAFHAIRGAMVEIVGGAAGTSETDSAGRYHIDASEGHYFLRVSHDGFRTVTTSLGLKRDEGRDVSFRLVADAGYSLALQRVAAAQMRLRLATRSLSHSRTFTHDDIAQMGARNFDDVVRRSGLAGSACFLTLDGIWTHVPSWAIDVADLEYVELYEGGGGAVQRAQPGAARVSTLRACSVTAFVWLRK